MEVEEYLPLRATHAITTARTILQEEVKIPEGLKHKTMPEEFQIPVVRKKQERLHKTKKIHLEPKPYADRKILP